MHTANGQKPPSSSPSAPAADSAAEFDEEGLCRAWPKLRGPLNLLRRWDAPRGIILEGDTTSAVEVATALAERLGGFRLVIDSQIRKADWDREVARYLDGRMRHEDLRKHGKERLCIIVPRMDQQPLWLQSALTAPMDSSSPPGAGYCVLATAVLAAKIPASISSHLFLVRKTGRPRLFTADEVPMPPAEMRLPPGGEEEPTLFSVAGAE